MNRFQKLCLTTIGVAVAQTALGTFVRTSGSGLGCGTDWPKCRGAWLPPLETTAVIEYLHRLTASLLGLLVVALAIYAWLRFRRMKAIFWPSMAALAVVGFQGWLGQQVVDKELARGLVAVHFFNAMTLVGLLVALTVNTFSLTGEVSSVFFRRSVLVGATVFVAIMAGALVAQSEAGLVFADWPLMNGRVIPNFSVYREVLHWAHRVFAALAGIATSLLAFKWSGGLDRTTKAFAHGAFGLWLIQVVVGATTIFFKSPPWTVVLHVLAGTLLWASIVTLMVVAFRRAAKGGPQPALGAAKVSVAAVVKAYFMLTKPRIIELLLITTVPAMIVAQRGWPRFGLVVATLLGGSLSAGGANAINCFIDRDIDAKMQRTSGRPLPSHKVRPLSALVFGVLLGLAGFVVLSATVNLLSGVLATAALLFYVFVYTIAIKRSTPSNIVIGGAAGGVPVLVGWAAVTGSVGMEAIVMFAIIFYWTPPHFWALALRYSADYARAEVPMLPVVRGVAETTRQMVFYSVILFAVSLLLQPVAELGAIYLVGALVLGIAFVSQTVRLHLSPGDRGAMALFRSSITYLTLLFAAMAADRVLAIAVAPSFARISFVVAAAMFFAAQAAIVFAVLGYRTPVESQPRADGSLLAEIVWTSVPTIVVAALFVTVLRTLAG